MILFFFCFFFNLDRANSQKNNNISFVHMLLTYCVTTVSWVKNILNVCRVFLVDIMKLTADEE